MAASPGTAEAGGGSAGGASGGVCFEHVKPVAKLNDKIRTTKNFRIWVSFQN
jgi:hypothetical protein